MDEQTRDRLRSTTLEARALLTDEARALLAGVYGLADDGCLAALDDLPAIQALPEAAETRARLEVHLRDERAAGREGRGAVARLVKEIAFTHLNRLVAFKLLEARKLIKGTIDRGNDDRVRHAQESAPQGMKRVSLGTASTKVGDRLVLRARYRVPHELSLTTTNENDWAGRIPSEIVFTRDLGDPRHHCLSLPSVGKHEQENLRRRAPCWPATI